VDLAAERAAIQDLLERYVAAYERRDEEGLRAFCVNFNRTLIRSVDLTITAPTIELAADGQSATLRATQQFRYEFNNRPTFERNPKPGVLSWKLQKAGGVWRVVC
jgi:hypothetical protein